MSKKHRRQIIEGVWNFLRKAALRITSSRVLRWIGRQRAARFAWRVVYMIWSTVSRYVWWPVKRRIRKIRRFANRRDAVIWLAAWGICAWIGYAILNEGFIRGLMLGLIVAIAYVILCFRSPLAGMIIWLVTSPFLTLYVRVKPLQGIPVLTGDRYCLLVLLLVYLIQLKRTRARNEPFSPLHGAMFVFIVAMLLAGLKAATPRRDLQDVLDAYAVPFFVYLFARRWIIDQRKLALAFACIVIVGVYFSAIGISEHITGRLFFGAHRWGWVEESLGTVRVQGPAESPSEFGLIVLISTLLAMTAIANESKSGKRFIYGVFFAITLTAIALTLRRSVYISTFLAIIFMLRSGRKTRTIAASVLLIAAIAVIGLWQPITASKLYRERMMQKGPVYSRVVTYATSWAIVKDHALLGVGLKNYPEYRNKYLTGYKNLMPSYGSQINTPHNAYLRILIDAGLLALVPYLTVLLLMFMTSIRAYRRAKEAGLLGRDGIVVFWAFSAAVCQDALTEDIFTSSRYLLTLWFFFFGAIIGVHLQGRRASALAQDEMDRQKPERALSPAYQGNPRRAI